MLRRQFLKSSLVVAGAASSPVVFSDWSANNKIRFGYFYPSKGVSNLVSKTISKLNTQGVETEVHNLAGMQYKTVLEQLQSGYYAGVLISTDVVSEVVPELSLLSDGPDQANPQLLENWFAAESQLWDSCLQAYNLKRVPFCAYGPRRGIWLSPKLRRAASLKDLNIYSYGHWANIFESLNVQTTHDIFDKNLNAYMASNLIIAEQLKLIDKFSFLNINNKPSSSSSSPSSDFYLNQNFWKSLSEESQNQFITEAAQVSKSVKNSILEQDELLYKNLIHFSSDIINDIDFSAISKKLRLESVAHNFKSNDQMKLFESYMKTFDSVAKVDLA